MVSRPPRPAPACTCAALVSFPSFWRPGGSGSRGTWSGATRTRPLAGLLPWLLAREDFLPLLQPRMVTAHPTQRHAETGSWRRLAVLECFSFKPTFSLSSFTFIKRLFSSSSLSAISVVSSAYLRLLIFLPAILIPACASSSPVLLVMYSAYKLNMQGDNIQP